MSRKRNQRRRQSGKSSSRSSQGGPTSKLSSEILELLQENPNESYSQRQIGAIISPANKVLLRKLPSALQKLVNKGRIDQLPNGNFKALSTKTVTGRVDHVNPRFCYVVVNDLESDIWVKQSNMKGSIHEDIVEVEIYKNQRHGLRPEGVIKRLVERPKSELVGKFTQSGQIGNVEPDNKKIYFSVLIKPQAIGKARPNDKVVVKIEDWPTRNKPASGVIREVLGQTGEHEAEIHSIMAEFNLPFRFPKEVEALADQLHSNFSQQEIARRKDIRETVTFTIDPIDAKDFDDALSIKKLDNGRLEIGIHIADVSHYVIEDSVIDKEAKKRATSVYLVDRTIPMLPEKLSNDLCSLRPNEDKFTYSAIFEMDLKGTVHSEWFGKTIIHSDRRFTYEEAQEVIEGKSNEFEWEIKTLNDIALALKEDRFRHGSINFETQEYRFQLDTDGTPIELTPKVRVEAHKLVEDFMLLANKRVAEYVFRKMKGKKERTFVYRTHDLPDGEKLMAFSVFAQKFGHSLSFEKGDIAKSLNLLISDIEGKPEQNVLQILAIRSMAKAIYTTDEKGHFGLNFDHYTHFTSPIRRYPDLMVHRLLTRYLADQPAPEKPKFEELCKHSSVMEKNASDAERASIKFKQVEFMSKFLGEEFEGIISGITEWGLFVEIIETRCEGMVRISDISDDHYSFDEINYRLIGLHNKRILTLGDHVTVQVVKTDIDHRTIDLDLILKDD